MNKKLLLCAVLALLLSALCVAALGATANAVIVAPKTVKVTAPYAGTLLPFDLSTGDAVSAGDVLFAYDVTPIYARQDGVVSAVFAKTGDDASGVISHYGALAVVEPTNMKYLAASTSQAYDKEDNKTLHAGETVWLKYNDEKGTGLVTGVKGDQYTVEILTGDFKLRNNVSIYRSTGYDYDTCVGKGIVTRYDDMAITGAGRIAEVHVQPGQHVKTGDVLFCVVDAQSDAQAGTKLQSPADGAVTMINTLSGAQVYRGQLLCEIADMTALELSAEVDEIDLSGVSLGSTLTFTLDAYAGETFVGTVKEIRPLGTKKQNASYFDVRLTLPAGKTLLPGMNATVTLGK